MFYLLVLPTASALLECDGLKHTRPLWSSDPYPLSTIGWEDGPPDVGFHAAFPPMLVASIAPSRQSGCAFHAVKHYGNCTCTGTPLHCTGTSCGKKVLVGTEVAMPGSDSFMYLELGLPSARASGFALIFNYAEYYASPPAFSVRANGATAPPTRDASIVLAAALTPDSTPSPPRAPIECVPLGGTWHEHRRSDIAVQSDFATPQDGGLIASAPVELHLEEMAATPDGCGVNGSFVSGANGGSALLAGLSFEDGSVILTAQLVRVGGTGEAPLPGGAKVTEASGKLDIATGMLSLEMTTVDSLGFTAFVHAGVFSRVPPAAGALPSLDSCDSLAGRWDVASTNFDSIVADAHGATGFGPDDEEKGITYLVNEPGDFTTLHLKQDGCTLSGTDWYKEGDKEYAHPLVGMVDGAKFKLVSPRGRADGPRDANDEVGFVLYTGTYDAASQTLFVQGAGGARDGLMGFAFVMRMTHCSCATERRLLFATPPPPCGFCG